LALACPVVLCEWRLWSVRLTVHAMRQVIYLRGVAAAYRTWARCFRAGSRQAVGDQSHPRMHAIGASCYQSSLMKAGTAAPLLLPNDYHVPCQEKTRLVCTSSPHSSTLCTSSFDVVRVLWTET